MIHIDNKVDCCGCHACMMACNFSCISMVPDAEGFLYPQANGKVCIECGICEKVCPMLQPSRLGDAPKAFASWHRIEEIRTRSSSGGVFSALMDQTLNLSGVVVGAAFDKTMILRHQLARNLNESCNFRGSKYVQSVIGGVYLEVKECLQQGSKVLFSGTPCQIAGLNAYLGRDAASLTTCDLVCHGVPSPKVFKRYIQAFEERHGRKIQSINFRSKELGWKNFSILMTFDDSTVYCSDLKHDPFLIGFLRDIYLRPSCHECRFSRLPRVADISLADYWGVGGHHPEWDDDLGTSLVLIQTEKGQKAFDACCNDLIVHESDLDLAILSNPCIAGSVPPNKNRSAFFHDLERLPFDKLMLKYMSPPSLWTRLPSLPRRIMRYGLRRINRLFQTDIGRKD